MSPNANQLMQINEIVGKQSSFVPFDRLLEVAKQLAAFEMSQESLVDNCVSLLDSTPDYFTSRYGSLAGPPPPPVTPYSGRERMDKNYCEVVSVPSSTHVAQIVGKQGICGPTLGSD